MKADVKLNIRAKESQRALIDTAAEFSINLVLTLFLRQHAKLLKTSF